MPRGTRLSRIEKTMNYVTIDVAICDASDSLMSDDAQFLMARHYVHIWVAVRCGPAVSCGPISLVVSGEFVWHTVLRSVCDPSNALRFPF